LRVIRGLAEKCGKADIDLAAWWGAAWGGHTDVVDLLASEFGARIDVKCLTRAALWSHDAMIDHLVGRYGLDPNTEDELGMALDHAADHGRVRTVRHLVEKHNVHIHARNWVWQTALDVAEEQGRTECASYLRDVEYAQLVAGEYGGAGDYGGQVEEELLTSAARRGDDAMIDVLVERYAMDPNTEDETGKSAIREAVEYGRVRTVQHLVEKYNVDIHARVWYSRSTALHYAAKRDQIAMIDHLVERYGLDPNAVDGGGWTALHHAADHGHFWTVKQLVEKHNVDIHKRNRYGQTALDLVTGRMCRTECAAYLRWLMSTRPPPSRSS